MVHPHTINQNAMLHTSWTFLSRPRCYLLTHSHDTYTMADSNTERNTTIYLTFRRQGP